jgi:hypothetical protein
MSPSVYGDTRTRRRALPDVQTTLRYKVHMNSPTPPPTADEPLASPDEALALIREQQRTVTERQLGGVPWILTAWAVSWGVGFLALWSGYDGGNPWFRVPLPVGGAIFGVLVIGAIVASAVLGLRMNRGLRGPSSFAGAVYGISWSVVSLAAFLIGIALLQNGMSSSLATLYFPAAYALVAGALYFMGAALWRSVDQLVLGSVIIVTGTAAPFFGAPTNNLVMAVLGGGSFLIAAIVMRVNLRRR